MKVRSFVVLLVAAVALIVSAIGFAQVKRPYHDGTVWDVSFIRVKPGMDTAYMNYLASDWKKEQEALKKAGIILSYKVIASEPHNPGDFNLMLMTEYKDLATMEASQQKADDLAQTVIGTDQQQMEGYKRRLEIREVLGDRLSREVILEPK
jgi:hypothetical protein